jgi:hypothetical protein
MSAAKSARAVEPFQLFRESQRSLWDDVVKVPHLGSFSVPSAEGVRIFSTAVPEVFRPSEILSNSTQSRRISQNDPVKASALRGITSVAYALPPALDPERFRILAAFDGTVLNVNGDHFIARLVNKLDASDIREEAEFIISEVPDADRPLISEGSMFYWHIGITEKPHGQQSKTSLIRFRRLPNWEERDIDDAKARALFLRAVLPLHGAEDEA